MLDNLIEHGLGQAPGRYIISAGMVAIDEKEWPVTGDQ